MSTQLILGGVGAIVGSFFGMPALGFMVGTLLGSIIDPPKIQGPRLGDTKLQKSTYGAMIPYVWGQGRIGVNIIDQTDLEEHEEKSGGKGGPEVTNYTYSASFICLLCAKLPNRDAAIIGITHLFMDGRLVWSTETGDEPPCTIYYGTESQEPDPTFEAINGVGRQPAYRGMAYLVFTDYFLTDFGNRIPNIEAVIFTAGGDIPWRVATFDAWPQGSAPFTRTTFAATYEDGVITTTAIARVGGTVATFFVNQFDVQGNQIGTEVVTDVGLTTSYSGMVGNLHAIVIHGPGPTDNAWWQLDFRKSSPYYLQYIAGHLIDIQNFPQRLQGNYNLYMDGRIYFTESDTIVCIVNWVNADGGVPTGAFGTTPYTLDDSYTASSVALAVSDGHVYVLVDTVPGQSPQGMKLWKMDRDLNLVTFWELPADSPDDTLLVRDADNFHVWGDVLAYFKDPGGEEAIRVVKLNQTGSPTTNVITDYGVSIHGGGRLHDIGGGLGVDDIGVYSLNPPPAAEILSNIVDDLASLTPATSYDNAELTDEVRWFVIGSQMTVRNALDKLRPLFFFDIVEEDYTLRAYKRGDRAVVPFDDDDLCARPYDEEPGDPLKTIRKREQELPRTITLTYIDVDSDWQTGAQSSPRQTTLSEYDVTLECPVGLTAEEAAQKCWTIQAAEWNERESFEWSAPRWYDYVTPCTLARVRGRIIRVRSVTANPLTGVLDFEGVLAAPSLYTQVAPGAIYAGGEIADTGGQPGGGSSGGGGGGGAQDPPTSKVDTYLVLLDIPVLSQGDAPFGFYTAMAPAKDGPWASATLYKSLDGGATYAAVAQATTPAIIGFTAASPIGSPTIGGTLASYAGGDVVDESEICIVLGNDNDELSSITAAGLINGGNLCAISRGTFGSPSQTLWEIVGVRDCVLMGTDSFDRPVYRLKGFLRGRKDTLTTGHGEGDIFVFLPSVVNVDAPESELNQTFQYKAVTSGKSVADVAPQDFTNTGESSDEWHDVVLENLDVFVGACGSPFSAKKGLVPAPTAAMCSPLYVLTSDGNWTIGSTFSGTGTGSASWDWVFGNGVDSSATCDGAGAVAGMSRVGSVYTMTRSAMFTTLTVDAGVSIRFNQIGPLACSVALVNNGHIDGDGNNASGSTGGLGAVSNFYSNVGAGGNGGATGGAPAIRSLGGSGGAGGLASGAPATGGGPAGGNAAAPTAVDGGDYPPTTLAMAISISTPKAAPYGCAGGGGGGTVNSGPAGGGGGGGWTFTLFARTISGSGTITSKGGNGANASGANGGGGGGGGGGAFWVVTTTTNWEALMSPSVTGGSPGTGTGGGRTGIAGNNGKYFSIIL